MCLIVCYKSLCFIMVSQLFIYIYINDEHLSVKFYMFQMFYNSDWFLFEVIQQLRIRKMNWFPPELGSAESKLISQLGDVLGRIREAVKSPWGDCELTESPFVAKNPSNWVIGSLGHWVGSIFGDPPGFSGENTHGVRWTLVTLAAKPWRLLSTSHSVDLRQVRGWRRWASTHWISSGLSDWALPW